MHSCCYCVEDDSSAAGFLDVRDVAAENVVGLTDLQACRPGYVRPVCPVQVESCAVQHSRLETCLTYLNDYVMFADFVLHFFVGFKHLDPVTRMETTVWNPKLIARHFTGGKHPSQFGMMLLGALPIDTYFRVTGQFAVADSWRVLRFVRLPRVAELHRTLQEVILHLVVILPQLTSYVHLVQLVLGIGIIGHLLACLLYFVGNPNMDTDDCGTADHNPCGWVKSKGLQESEIHTKYIAAMYYAFTQITTVGFGDISASTNFERVFSICSQLVGGFVFGYVLGNIQQILAADNVGQQEYNTMHEKVIEYMRQENIPVELRNKVLAFLNSKYPTHTLFSEAEIMAELTPSLRSELLMHKYAEYIHHVPFLSNINFTENITTSLCSAVQLNHYYHGDTIARQGNVAKYLYIVNTGAVAELHQKGEEEAKPRILNILGPGDYWGECAILIPYRHYHTHTAKTFCTVVRYRAAALRCSPRAPLLSRPTKLSILAPITSFWCIRQCALSRDKVFSIASDHPVFGTAMANIVRIFSKKLKSKNPDVDLQAVTATLMDTQEKQGEDDEYSSKVHLSDVMRELRAQVGQHRSVPTGAVPNTFPFA